MVLKLRRSAIISLCCVVNCILVATLGCSGRPKNVARKVSGTVTLGGQPLTDAAVAFTSADGNTSYGGTDLQGKYNLIWANIRGRQIEGAQIGDNTVTISTFKAGSPEAKPPVPDTPEKVPHKYRSEGGFLKATVKAGVNTIDFALEPGPVDPPQPKTKGKIKGKTK